MKENLTIQDIVNYELAGVKEISANSPINRFPALQESNITEEDDDINILYQTDSVDELPDIQTMAELYNAIKNFDKCYIKKTATNTVLGKGNPDAKLLIIGEAPGADEDKQGVPYAGENSKLLTKMLHSINLDIEKDCFYVNIIPWRPPGNRAPSPSEIADCLPFIKKYIELINPDFILCFGAISFNAINHSNLPINKARGNWVDYQTNDGKNIKMLATYSPSFLIKSPAQKKYAWADLLTLKQELIEK